jgi:hypothetical protein
MKIFLILNLLFLLNITFEKLLSVYSIVRHAARTSQYYSKDTLSNLFGAYSKITINGIQQSQNLGRAFRKRYIEEYKFLNEKYDKKLVKFQTGSSQRTIFSMYNLINGLYPNYLIDIKSNYKEKLPDNNYDIPFNDEDKFNSENKIIIEILPSALEKSFEPKKCIK